MFGQTYKDFESLQEVAMAVRHACDIEGDRIQKIIDPRRLQDEVIWDLAFNASVNERHEVKRASMSWILEIGKAMNITFGSNVQFYNEKAEGKHEFFTVPAVNSRMLTFHTARAGIRAADALELPHIIWELALSEVQYTAQKKDEYSALILAAYISRGIHRRTIYVQADHYQLDPKKYTRDPLQEMDNMKAAIVHAIEHGVYNIDIDCSKFETLNPDKSDKENQAENARLTAELLVYIRQYEKDHPLPVTISVGGEVGEVGGENTRYPQVNAYLELIYEHMKAKGMSTAKGLSKVSINVGSSHGGVRGPDGKPLPTVPLDFIAHHDLYTYGRDPMSRGHHVLSVQHGASTLPKQYFALFPAMHVAEIHLATGFQDIVWDVIEKHDSSLFQHMKELVFEKFQDKIADHDTDAIGFMKERKRVTEFVKRELLFSSAISHIEDALEQEFSTIFHSLFTLFHPKKARVESGDRAD